MGQSSAIEWTGDTWNPVTGCTKVSPACAQCYIERQTPMRVYGRKFVKGDIPLVFHESRLDAPLRKRKPTVYFVNSMSDLFHEDIPDAFIDRVFAAMALSPHHTFQVLTKRAARMRDYLSADHRHAAVVAEMDMPSWLPAGRRFLRVPENWPMPNVWLGVSVENQHFADERIPLLLQTPAAVRFLSCEPLLGPLNLKRHVAPREGATLSGILSMEWIELLDWVIAGGESGPRVRPSDPAWFRSLRDQCVAARVPFFFKQWGGKTAKSGGRLLDGRTWDEMPRTPGEAQSVSNVVAEDQASDPQAE